MTSVSLDVNDLLSAQQKYAIYQMRSLDSTGRLRVSNPVTIFEGNGRPTLDQRNFESKSTGSGSVAYDDTWCTTMLKTPIYGDRIVWQSRDYLSRQSTKGRTVYLCAIMQTGSKIRTRVGVFDDAADKVTGSDKNRGDGHGFECYDGKMSVFERSSTRISGTPDRVVPQAEWNNDKLDGTGPSGLTVDFDGSMIIVIDQDGSLISMSRIGLLLMGRIVYCHYFLHDNSSDDTPFMSTTKLPVRYEQTNENELAVAGSPDQTFTKCLACVAVVEAGYSLRGDRQDFTCTTDVVLQPGQKRLVWNVRIGSWVSRTSVVIRGLTIMAYDDSASIRWGVIAFCMPVNSVWTAHPAGAVETDTTATDRNFGIESASGLSGGRLNTFELPAESDLTTGFLASAIDGTPNVFGLEFENLSTQECRLRFSCVWQAMF